MAINIKDISNLFGGGFGNIPTYTPPAVDSTFSSGLNYAKSIAGGQNVPNMISSGTSYSSAMPQGFTQADINSGAVPNPFGQIDIAKNVVTPPPEPPKPDDPSFLGTGIGGVNIPVDRKQDLPPKDILFGNSNNGNFPPLSNLLDIGKLFAGEIDFSSILDGLNLNLPNTTDAPATTPPPVIPGAVSGPVDMPPPISIGGVGGKGIEDKMFIEKDFFTPKEKIQVPVDIPAPMNMGGPVDLPGIGGPSINPIPTKQKDQIFIDDIPRFDDIPSKEYVVPEVPLNNLLNQNPPQGPVGMSPQETAKMSSQQELLNLISNKDILKEIPADDGVRNQYQVELDEYINKSPINMDTYKEELPIGSAINLGIPSIMETVVPMAVPGLGLAKNISDSLSSNNNPSPAPRPSTPSVSRPSKSGIDYSSVRRFGR